MTTTDKPTYKVIGTRPVRPDGVEKVTGKAVYGADINPAGLIYGKLVRSPHAHARITSIDTSAAEAVTGVLAVATAKDIPVAQDSIEELGEGAVNIRELSENVLASEKVLYHGHAVAAVAATSSAIAEEAAKLVKVEYEPLPPVLDVRDAMRDDAPLLDDNRHTKINPAGESSDKPSNIATITMFQLGEPDEAMEGADFTLEREYTTRMVHQGYIEPQTSTAQWNTDGTLTIWTSTQGAFVVRTQVAQLLKLNQSSIKVVPLEIGGGFGGKISIYLDPVAAVLSRKARRPVKMTMSRTEVLQATGPTSGTWIRLKYGVKDGKIVAADATLAYEAGAFPGSPVGAGAMTMLAPYDIPNIRIDARDVVVNKPKVAAYRAPGAPSAAFAAETLLDEIAEKLEVDPLSFRAESSSKEGTKMVTGVPFNRIGHEESVQAALASDHYNSPIEGPNRGRGVASGFWFNAGLQSAVVGSVNVDGTVNLIEGSTDIGGTRASLAMQLAETLGVAYEDVRPSVADTDSVPYNDVTGGSRVTFASGQAVYELGLDLQNVMRERAAKLWGADLDKVTYDASEAMLREEGGERRSIGFKDLAAQQGRTGGPIVGKGAVTARGVGAAFATHIVDVEVDPDTGKVDILRYTAVQDAGKAIHPSYVEGQMQGGVAQGIGWALNEEYFYDDEGHLVNASLLDYRMPTSLDLPDIETTIVEVPNPNHPYGVRGVGEVPIVPPIPAIANAIYRATGQRFYDLPMSPRRLVETLHNLG